MLRYTKCNLFMTGLALIFGLYVGSYFWTVDNVQFGVTHGNQVAVAPHYRYIPRWLDATSFYHPIHLVDRRYLRRSKWQARMAENGELRGVGEEQHRRLFSFPITNAP